MTTCKVDLVKFHKVSKHISIKNCMQNLLNLTLNLDLIASVGDIYSQQLWLNYLPFSLKWDNKLYHFIPITLELNINRISKLNKILT